MQLRHLLAPVVVPALAAAVALLPTATAVADPPGSTSPQNFSDDWGDAEPLVDIFHVHTYRTATDFRATVKYGRLGPANGLRYYVSFSPSGTGRTTAQPPTSPNGNLVELRRTPGGQLKTLSFRTTNGEDATPASCAGTRAVPDYEHSKITFIIDNACWKGDPGSAYVDSGARRYPSGTFDSTSNPPTLGDDDQSDALAEPGTWIIDGRES